MSEVVEAGGMTFLAENDRQCPIEPLEFNVVVRPQEVAEQTKGGVFIPQETKDREQYGHQRGTLVAISGNAFTDEHGEKWPNAPDVGDVVMFIRYAGTLVDDMDGGPFRVMKDKDVLGVLSS